MGSIMMQGIKEGDDAHHSGSPGRFSEVLVCPAVTRTPAPTVSDLSSPRSPSPPWPKRVLPVSPPTLTAAAPESESPGSP
jgi:hypothetical protein